MNAPPDGIDDWGLMNPGVTALIRFATLRNSQEKTRHRVGADGGQLTYLTH